MSLPTRYFPRPYPDELIYSAIARCGRHLGIRSPKALLDYVFENRSIVSSMDLQGRLSRLQWAIEGVWRINAEQAASEHTLLPYYLAYRGAKEKQRLVAALVADEPHSLHLQLGICAGTVRMPSVMRLCTRCAEEDITKYGETYWHRVHQLPGVVVCPTHRAVLHDTSVPTRSTQRHDFIAVTPKIAEQSRPCVELTESELELAYTIAQRSRVLLDEGWSCLRTGDRAELQSKLRGLGLFSGQGRANDIARAFRAFYGATLLAQFEACGLEGITWLTTLGYKVDRQLHPLRHILVEVFIEWLAQEPAQPAAPFGAGPWPCMNWLATHHRHSVVKEMELFHDHRHPERVLGRFHCDCGFVFTRCVGDDNPDRPFAVIEFGSLFVERARQLRVLGYSTRRIAGRLGVDWKTAKRFVTDDDQAAARRWEQKQAQLREDKKEWAALIKANPNDGVKALCAVHSALYARIYRNDRQWLSSHSPAKAKTTGTGSARVDWAARDLVLSQQLQQEAERVRQESPLRRVTTALLAARLDCRVLVEKKLDRLPTTAATLSRVCESEEEFRVRRIRHVLSSQSMPLAMWDLLRRAAVRHEYVTPEMLARAGIAEVPSVGDKGGKAL